MTIMKGLCTSSSSRRGCCERRQHQQVSAEERVLKGMSHEERLHLISKYKFFGYGSIGLGGIILIVLISMVVQLRWDRLENRLSVIVQSVVFGMGIGPSLILIFGESSRHFEYVTKVQMIDDELLETATVSIEEEEEDDDNDNENDNDNREEQV